MTAPAPALVEIERIYDDGRYLDAFAALRVHGGPLGVTSPRARVLASRILGNLGASQLPQLLTIRAHRADRRDPHVAYYYSGALAESRGPLAALRFLERFGVPDDADAETRALLLLMRAHLLALLRDFAEADALWRRAEAIWQHPWIWVERSFIAMLADRWAEAEETVARALAQEARYRPALQQMAHMLTTRGERERAAALLAEHSPALQSPLLLLQLAQLCYDLDRAPEALAALRAAVALMAWPEAAMVQKLSGLAAGIWFKLGDLPAAARFGRMTGAPIHARLAARLEAAPPSRKVLLPVPFVRQDHKTCAPATLTSLCRFHDRPADHVSIVEEICFDGTPAANERRWAEEHGFVARHFTVTWDAAVALLDRRLPFALLTVDVGSAHLQAVIGYDMQRGSLLLRDPSVPVVVELDAEPTLANQRFAGPQGLVLVPSEQAARLDGLALPDFELHDRLYRLQQALLRHARPEAAAELEALEAAHPDHVVTAQAIRALAAYDGNQAALLRAYDKLLAIDPTAAPPLLGKLSCLDGLARPAERRHQLAEAAARPQADPLFGRLWAEELARDARHAGMAELWLASAARRRPGDPQAYASLADLAAQGNDLPTACRLQRLAACLDDMQEVQSDRYFRYARMVRRAEEALAFLGQRVERLGKRAAGPWLTMHAALQLLDRAQEAGALLERAQAARPDDAELLLHASSSALRAGRLDEARALLERARGGIRETTWIGAAAQLDRAAGARDAALGRWRAVLAADPMALEAHAAVANLLSEAGDREGARAHVQAAADANPHHAGLLRLLAEVTDDEGERGLQVLRRLIALAPADAWAGRELALRLARRQRIDEASAELERVAALDPESSSTHGVRGFVLAAAGRREEAREAFRQALGRSADYVAAFDGLLDQSEDVADRLRAVRFLQKELRRQVVFGDGLHAFRTAARGLLPDGEILEFLEEGRKARRDLRASWSAVIQHLLAMERLDDARRIGLEAAAQFPMVAEPLLILAAIEDQRGDQAARREALARCLVAEPGHAVARRALADALERGGDAAGARDLLEKAVAEAPLDVAHRCALAELLARSDDLPGAFAALEAALEREPATEWAWERLGQWAATFDAHDAALAVADAVIRARPDAGGAHFGRARLLMGQPGHHDDALRELDLALERDPRSVDAHDQRALLLARLQRFDEALAACRPASFGDVPPVALRGRRAWILAEQGKLDDAIREMEELVAASPAYLFGLASLGDWYTRKVQLPDARHSYERLLAIYAGQPDAAFGLFDVCMAQGDLDACERALALVRGQDDSPFLVARRIMLACRRGHDAEAEASYARLCGLPQSGIWPLLEAGRALAARRGGARVLGLIEQAMADGRAVGDVPGEAWAHLASGASRPLGAVARLRRLLARGRAEAAAAATFVEDLAENRSKGLFWIALVVGGRGLRRATRVWGAVGYGLVVLGWNRLAARWMRDYARRDDARPWMLNNLVMALVQIGRPAGVPAISRRALALPPDQATDMHRRWLAFHLALDGDAAEARALLERKLVAAGGLSELLEDYTRALLAGGEEARRLIDETETKHAALLASKTPQRLREAVRSRKDPQGAAEQRRVF